jgi:hypothetical protein
MTDPKHPKISNNCSADNCEPPYKNYNPDKNNKNVFEKSGCGWMIYELEKDAGLKMQVSGAVAMATIYAALSL